jgi:serine/threonine protein kinase
MSPEQARGDSIDRRSDLFSLGSVLYMLCTGRPPFRAETSYGILRRISDDEPRPIRELNPEIPDWLCAIIGKLLAKSPADRFQSAEKTSSLLEQCLAHVQQPNAVPLPDVVRHIGATAARAASRNRKRMIVASATVATVVVALGGWLVLSAWRADNARAVSQSAPDVSANSSNTQQPDANSRGARWDDDIPASLDALERDVTDSEQAVRRFWDDGSFAENRPIRAYLQDDLNSLKETTP